MYKTELHCHSSDISRCASATCRDIVETYVAAGYSTVVLTNHLNRGTMRRHGFASLGEWPAFIDKYLGACDALREAADGRLHILPGAELRFNAAPAHGDINDYLLFGVTREFLLAYPDMLAMTPATFAPLAREAGVLFVQAHPLRDNMHLIPPAYLDGMEVYNGNPSHNSRNEIAAALAAAHGLLCTAGTDYHHATEAPNGGIATAHEIRDAATLVRTLREGSYELIRGQ